ncbi:hypothetical protein [Kutzneria sp. CA-103260]|nr:hypothetical protein [Kutzneria sp. CA-103260]
MSELASELFSAERSRTRTPSAGEVPRMSELASESLFLALMGRMVAALV